MRPRKGGEKKSPILLRKSRDDFPNRRPVIDREPLPARYLQAARIKAELMHERRMDIRDVMAVFDRMEAELVGCAMHNAALEAAASQHGGEAVNVMIAAIASLRPRRSAELGRRTTMVSSSMPRRFRS